MKCFHFTSGEDDGDFLSRKLSWARSLSVASTSSNSDTRRLREYHKGADSSDSLLIAAQVRRANDLRAFRLSELKSATRGFSRALVVGEGGFGCVYKGRVKLLGSDNEFDVAVKQLNRNGFQGHKEWINEVNYLGVVKHPNLVKLIGYCAADDERGIQRLLVYEFLQNKSLEDHLLTQSTRPLPWIVRLKIARDAARGLAYLHEDMEFQLIFRDFKASNILLDEDFNAKLSDFGLARQGPASGLDHVSTSVVGTVGYAAPEYVHTGRLTTKSDVWSFGVVLYEIITGRRVLERNLPRGEQKLLEWVRPYVSDSKRFHLILDPRLEEGHNNGVVKSAQKLAFLANKCLMKHPRLRPKMSQVIEMLECIISELAENPFACCVVVERVNDEDNDDDERESDKAGNDNNDNNSNNRRGKNGFDFRDLVSRNRSLGRLDWRNWTLGFVRT